MTGLYTQITNVREISHQKSELQGKHPRYFERKGKHLYYIERDFGSKIPSFWESTLDYFERKGKHLYLMWSRDIVRVDITERGCGSAGISVLQVGRVGITGQYSLNLRCMC